MNLSTMEELMAATTTMEDLSSSTDEDYDIPDLLCDRATVRQFRSLYEPPLFWLIAVVGGVGNLAVVWIFVHVRRRLKTMTDMYLLNLAVADLLFLVTLPLWAAEASFSWTFGPILCKLNSALYKVNLFSSMLLLTCISIDRYIVIVQTTKAHNSRWERLRYSRFVCGVVWLFSVVLAIPEFVYATPMKVESQLYCRMVFPSHVGNITKISVLSLQVSMGFCLPFIVMAYCYAVIVTKLLKTRSFEKHKAMRVILVVVVVFVVSQLPYNSVLIVEAMQATNMTITNCESMKAFDMTGQVLKSLAYLHACLNPFMYVFVGVRFRRDMLQLLSCCRCHGNRGPMSKVSKMPPSSTRLSVMSDSDNSQALSL